MALDGGEMRNLSFAEIIIVRKGNTVDKVMIVVIVSLLVIVGATIVAHCYSEISSHKKGKKEKKASSVTFRQAAAAQQTDCESQTRRNRLVRQSGFTLGDEWFQLFEQVRQSSRADVMTSVFFQYDADKTGRITVEKFAKFIGEKAGELGLNSEEKAKVIREADVNDDGYVGFLEFAVTMMAVRHRRAQGLSLVTTKAMLSQRQQTDAARLQLDYSCCPPPTFLISLALLEIFFYFYQVDLCGWKGSTRVLCTFDKLLAMDPAHPFQVWRYLTFILVHWNATHLVGNVFGQFVFGTTLELAHRWRIVVVFLLGSINSGLFAATMANSRAPYVGGASGGVFALVAAHIANVTLNWKEMKRPYMHLFFALIYIAYTLTIMALSGRSSATSFAGHIGGFIGGILLGLLFLRNVVKEEWEVKVQKASLTVYLLFTFFCIAAITVRAIGPDTIDNALG
ncbi:rhomboid family protein [Aphelenchoides avenae]|nr:rhomboid family protein [Aphelenchus avenae]